MKLDESQNDQFHRKMLQIVGIKWGSPSSKLAFYETSQQALAETSTSSEGLELILHGLEKLSIVRKHSSCLEIRLWNSFLSGFQLISHDGVEQLLDSDTVKVGYRKLEFLKNPF